MADGRAHAPAFLAVAHHHVGDDFLLVLDGNGEVEFHLGVAGDDGVGLAAEGRIGIVQTGQLGGVAPFHGTRPGAVPEVAAEQGELADPEGIENALVVTEKLVIRHIAVDGLGQVQQRVRLLTQAVQPFPCPEIGGHGAYFLTRSE